MQDRRKEILDILCKRGKASVTELSKMLFVSEMTIRRDFKDMEKDGILKRYRGGAVFCGVGSNSGISQRFFIDEGEKKMLSKKAVSYLHDDMKVYIDSSSTCQYIIPHIAFFKNITIVTNSLNAVEMASKLHIPCFLIGGKYYEHDMCFVGSVAESNAAQFNVDVSFFSSLGISEDGVISDNDIEQVAIRKIIMKNSKKNIFLFENNKLNKKYFFTLCCKNDVDAVITIY